VLRENTLQPLSNGTFDRDVPIHVQNYTASHPRQLYLDIPDLAFNVRGILNTL